MKIDPIEDKFPNAVRKVAIPNAIIDAAIEFLNLSNINEYSVFPDFAGISGYLRREANLVSRWP